MNEFSAILKKINNSINKEVTNFVYYSKDGEIHKVTNAFTKSDSLECIEVPHDSVKDIIIGKHKLSDYIVSFNPDSKKFTVKLKQKKLTQQALFYNIPAVLFTKEDYVFYFNPDVKKTPSTKPVYENIFVDIWYNELEHLAGQHVWHNYSVYKILNYQEKDTVFDMQFNIDAKLMESYMFQAAY